ncbi:MAG TPA: 3-phosphoshikimate 1-carboxyvinyltransferase [Sediminispirochaeta sp.]|nr:3-phosphoshikimate 1-carboxyvinyltransferase [Sediminispirochaeta sp.]
MIAKVRESSLNGELKIPGSKSHMIRALFFAALGRGTSTIREPVFSKDALSALGIIRALGIEVDDSREDRWIVDGGRLQPADDVLNVGNSGTTMNLGSALLASLDAWSVVTGDEQIRRRPAQPVLEALCQLGAESFTVRDNGSAPFLIRGPLIGGHGRVDGLISQYASSALIAASLARTDTEIEVVRPNEVPYLEMTLSWMRSLGLEVQASEKMDHFWVKSGQEYQSFDLAVPGDFSSAAFFLVGAAITESRLLLRGLRSDDVQGDKVLIDILREMGADIEVKDLGERGIEVRGGAPLKGITIDCGDTPDSVPILSVLGCYAAGETRLKNIASSRQKETDRPLLMERELKKMGARIRLEDDELVISNSRLYGSEVDSHRDHRIAMALCVAGMIAQGVTTVAGVESATVSYPGFDRSLTHVGAEVEFIPDIPDTLEQ